MQKDKKYDLSLLFSPFVNTETITESINSLEKRFGDGVLTILNKQEVGRYDILHKSKIMRITFICCCIQTSVDVAKIVDYIKSQSENIVRHLITKHNYYIVENLFDYRRPINTKKYLFESLRIMNRELTKLSPLHQRILAKNIKRSRMLGLIYK